MKPLTTFLSAVFALTAILVLAQAPASFRPKPIGTLKQVMRSIPYPNSDIIYAVQNKAPQNDDEWKIVQNAAIAISETPNLITMPGRLRENGQPVPVKNSDWNKFAQGLATAGQVCYKAALAKDRDAVNKCTDGLAESCSNCHDVYRDRPK
jgi:cytochrome c556